MSVSFGGADGKIYDSQYQIDTDSGITAKCFPSLSDADNYDSYVGSVKLWKRDVIPQLNGVMPPLPLSMSVHKPEPPIVVKSTGFVKRKPDIQKNPPQPRGNIQMISTVLSGSDYTDLITEESAPMSAYINEKAHWGDTLIPMEPDPSFYDDYESYRDALLTWSQQVKCPLTHPSDLMNTMGVDSFEAEGRKFTEVKIQMPSFSDIKPFDAAAFANMKTTWDPPVEALNGLLEPLKHDAPMFSRGYRFVKNCAAERIVKGFMDTGPKDSLALTRKFKVWSDYTLDDEIIPQPDVCDLSANVSPSQAEKCLMETTNESLFRMQFKMCFWLAQLHIVQSNRVRAKIFLFLNECLQRNPSASLTLCFVDDQTVSNVTKLYSEFSNYSHVVYDFVMYPEMTENRMFCRLYSALFAWQLLVVFEWFFQGNKTMQLEIKPLKESYMKEIAKHLERPNEIRQSFSQACGKPRQLEMHVIMLHLMMDYDKLFIEKIFTETELTFFTWLGHLNYAPETTHLYSNVVAHVLADYEVMQTCFKVFFISPSTASSHNYLAWLNRSTHIISLIIRSQPKKDQKIDWLMVSAAFLSAIQLLRFGPSQVIDLVSAICEFYVEQIHFGVRKYRNRFGEFRVSIIHLFISQKMSAEHTVALLESVQCLLAPLGPDNGSFVSTFLNVLFGFMADNDESIVYSAWSTLREWILIDDAVCKCISHSETLKQAFQAVLRCAEATWSGKLQLAMLIKGVVKCKSGYRIRRSRGVANLVNPLIESGAISLIQITSDLMILMEQNELDEKHILDVKFLLSCN